MQTTKTTATLTRKGNFVENTITLVSGNFVARIITFTLAPIITRLYPPQVFGTFAILVSLAELFIAVSSLRYNNAIFLPKEKRDADGLVALCLLLVLVISCVCLAACAGFHSYIADLVHLKNKHILFFLPLLVFVGGLQQVTDIWFLRLQQFKRLAAAKISAATSDRISTIAYASFVSAGPVGLVLGRIIGVANVLAVLLISNLRPVKDMVQVSSLKRITTLSAKYVAFPKFIADAFIQRASVQAPLLMLATYFSPDAAGLYALTHRILGEPMTLIGDSLGRSFAQKASERFREGKDLAHDTLRLYRYILLLIAAPMLILNFIIADLFGIIFGAEWRAADDYVKLVIPVFIAVFAVRPMSIFYDLFERQKERLIHNSISLVVICCSFAAGYATDSVKFALMLYAISTTTVTLLRTRWLMSLAGVSWRKFWLASIRGFFWPLCVTGSVLMLQASPWQQYLAFYCLAAAIVYFIIILCIDNFLFNQLKYYCHACIGKLANMN